MANDKSGKPLGWLSGEIKTPPWSRDARIGAGYLLRKLQSGELLYLPHSRPMPNIGKRCNELRIIDKSVTWRVIYRIDDDAIIVVEVFRKTTRKTPDSIIKICQERLRRYDQKAGRD